jgi:hypothetical protein
MHPAFVVRDGSESHRGPGARGRSLSTGTDRYEGRTAPDTWAFPKISALVHGPFPETADRPNE